MGRKSALAETHLSTDRFVGTHPKRYSTRRDRLMVRISRRNNESGRPGSAGAESALGHRARSTTAPPSPSGCPATAPVAQDRRRPPDRGNGASPGRGSGGPARPRGPVRQRRARGTLAVPKPGAPPGRTPRSDVRPAGAALSDPFTSLKTRLTAQNILNDFSILTPFSRVKINRSRGCGQKGATLAKAAQRRQRSSAASSSALAATQDGPAAVVSFFQKGARDFR